MGLPVDLLTFSVIDGITGLTAEGGAVGLMNSAPHPHAAALFINWLLSREGQVATQKALADYGSQALDSFRTDIPKDHILPDLRRQEGVQYIDLQDPNRLDMRAIVKVFEEALLRKEKR